MRPFAFIVALAFASVVCAHDLAYNPDRLAPSILDSSSGCQDGVCDFVTSSQLTAFSLYGGVALALTPGGEFLKTHVIDSLYLRGQVDAAWIVSYDSSTYAITNYAIGVPTLISAHGTKTVSSDSGTARIPFDFGVTRYDFSASQIGGATAWQGQPLALLLGGGTITGLDIFYKTHGLTTYVPVFPAIIQDSSRHAAFSNGPFTDLSLDPTGQTLINVSSVWSQQPRTWTPEDGSTQLLPLGFSYSTAVPEPSTLVLAAVGVILCFANFRVGHRAGCRLARDDHRSLPGPPSPPPRVTTP